MNSASHLVILLITLFISFHFASSYSIEFLLCHPTCLTCSGPNSNQCITCLPGLQSSGSECLCPSTKYFTGDNIACKSCHSTCQTCSGPAQTDCLTCATGYQLYQGSCHAACSSTEYFDTTSLSCAPCNALCQTCNGQLSNQCTSCQAATLTNGACQCPTGYYTTSLGGCAKCDSSCIECSGPASTQCTACSNSMILQSGKCTCPTGFYQTSSPFGCQACNSGCLGCSGPSSSQCISCKNNLVLSSGQCQCPSGTYYDATTFSCLACSSLCTSCSGPGSSQCTACKNNLVLSSNQCICPTGTYLDVTTSLCKPCDATCQECSGPSSSQCTYCYTSLTLVSGQCKCTSGSCSCPSGKYLDTTSNTCLACDPTCYQCSGPSSTQCTHCRSDYLLVSGQCQCTSSPCTCPSKSYFDTGSSLCVQCNGICAECSSNSNQCSSCQNNMALSTNTCSCPAGTYLDSSNYCLSCDKTCDTCSGPSPSQCILCKSGLSKVSGLCQCPSDKYFDSSTKTCLSCDSNCQTCSGPEKNHCLSCLTPKVLNNGYCVNTCFSKEFRSTDLSCQSCDSSCQTCSGNLTNQCTSCPALQNIISGTCSTIKSNGCYYTCATCTSSSANDCLTCESGYVLVESSNGSLSCAQQCPIGYYVYQGTPQVSCKPKIQLKNVLGYGSQQNQVSLNFDRDISPFIQELLDSIKVDIKFSSSQPPITFKYSLTLGQTFKYLMLNLTFSGNLVYGNILQITYNLPSVDSNDNKSTICVTNTTQPVRLLETFDYTAQQSSYVNVVSSLKSIGQQANGVFSWTSSVLLRSVHAMRSQVVEDMIGYFIFMDIDFAPNFIKFADDGLNSLEIIIPNIFDYILNTMDNRLLAENTEDLYITKGFKQRRQLLSGDDRSIFDVRLDSYDFLSNHGAATTLLVLSLLLVIIIELLRILLTKLTKKKDFMKSVSHSFRWNIVIAHFASEYQGFVFFSALGITTNLKIASTRGYINFGIGLFMQLLSIMGVVGIFLLTRHAFFKLKALKEANETQKQAIEADLKRIGILHLSFRHEHYTHLLYPCLLFSRSFLFGMVLAFMSSMPFVQLSYLILTTSGIIGYLIYFKPLKTRTQNILTLIYESLFLSVIFFTLILHSYNQYHIDDVDTRTNLCIVILSLSTSMIVLNLVSFAFEVFEIRRMVQKNRKVVPLPNPSTRAVEASMTSTINIGSDLDDASAKKIADGLGSSDIEEKPNKQLLRKQVRRMTHQLKISKIKIEENDEETSPTSSEKKEVLQINSDREPQRHPSLLAQLGNKGLRKSAFLKAPEQISLRKSFFHSAKIASQESKLGDSRLDS